VNNDIVERLKIQAAEIANDGHCGCGNTMLDAAAEISQLRESRTNAGSEAIAFLVDGRIEQGLFFDRKSAENMAEANCGNVKDLFTAPPSTAQAVREFAEKVLRVADAERLRIAQRYQRHIDDDMAPMGGNLDWAELKGAVHVVREIRDLLETLPADGQAQSSQSSKLIANPYPEIFDEGCP
jgi:hypothetical protein